MRNLKVTLEYDGAAFFGFQRQPEHPTIQEHFENALAKLFRKKIKITAAAGRTDAGVHAESQVVNFKIQDSIFDAGKIQRALNGLLPRAIAVTKIEEVPENFHARYSAKSKTYEYRIWNHPARSPLKSQRTFHVAQTLDLEKIKQGAKILTGRHDFRSFCASDKGTAQKNTVRKIYSFKIKRAGPLLTFEIRANGFLYHMVRNLVGTLIDLGRGKIGLEDLRKTLKSRDRRRAGATAPARGLTLVDVTY